MSPGYLHAIREANQTDTPHDNFAGTPGRSLTGLELGVIIGTVIIFVGILMALLYFRHTESTKMTTSDLESTKPSRAKSAGSTSDQESMEMKPVHE